MNQETLDKAVRKVISQTRWPTVFAGYGSGRKRLGQAALAHRSSPRIQEDGAMTDESFSLYTTTQSRIALSTMGQPVIYIHGETGTALVTIHQDGRLEYGEGYTPDEAARIFWEAIAHMAPTSYRAAP